MSFKASHPLLVSCVLASCLIWASLIAPAPVEAQRIPEVGEIVTAREQVRGYVLDIKEKYKPSDKEYKEARRLFREAASEYEGWIADLKLAIVGGTARDLRKDEQYKQKSERAGRASKAFVDYAQGVTAESKGVLVFASAVADIGIKIWNAKKDRRARERASFAEAFAKEVKWERWEDITAKSSSRPATNAQ
jgi:hypothetical protein